MRRHGDGEETDGGNSAGGSRIETFRRERYRESRTTHERGRDAQQDLHQQEKVSRKKGWASTKVVEKVGEVF